jgi:hypothetical protein
MAIRPGSDPLAPIRTATLEQLAGLDATSFSAETAREVLEVRFTTSQQARVNDLSAKAREGSLTPAEDKELDDYLELADLLAIVQSKARRVLKREARRT